MVKVRWPQFENRTQIGPEIDCFRFSHVQFSDVHCNIKLNLFSGITFSVESNPPKPVDLVRPVNLKSPKSSEEQDLRSIEDILFKITDVYLNIQPERKNRQNLEVVDPKNPGKELEQGPDKYWNSITCLVTEGFGYLALASKAFNIQK